MYPWEGDFSPDKCNCKESNIGHTTSVKLYTSGKSIFGVCDLLGNIWEWTSTDGDDGKILKGGSWANSSGEININSQYVSLPGRKHRIIGFRIIQSQ